VLPAWCWALDSIFAFTKKNQKAYTGFRRNKSGSTMLDRQLKRYAAYFRGWCQAFGEHEGIQCEQSGIDWLLAEHQVGLVLPAQYIKPLRREVLLHSDTPILTFHEDCIQVGEIRVSLEKKQEQKALDAMASLLENPEEVHLYLTSHLLYGGGNRIITFSSRKPLLIIYKEIGAMRVRMV